MNGRLLITGDFNFPVDNKNDAQTQRFLRLLEACNLMQHLKVPTHQLRHTLDLAIPPESDNVSSNPIVTDQLISDHKFIMFNLPTAKPPLAKREISYRNLKALNLGAVCVNIQNSPIYSPEAGSPDDLVDLYNKNSYKSSK